MKNPSDRERSDADLRAKILGMGERSIRKSYYPALRRQMELLERYRGLLNQATNAISLLSFPGLRFIDTNPSACRLFGLDPQRQAEMRLTDLLDSDSASTIEQWAVAPPEAIADHLQLEALSPAAGGAGVVIDIWLTRVSFGESDYVVCVSQDVTERKEAEIRLHQALSETEEARLKIDTILRSVGDGLLVVGPEGAVSLLNPTAEEIIGTSFSLARGRPYTAVVAERGLRQQIARVLQGERRSLVCDWEDVEDGRRRTFRARTSPVLSPHALQSGAITILREITREREFDRMKDEFISSAAHELRTPLTALMGYAELLNSSEDFGTFGPEQQREFLSIIQEKAFQLNRIVDDLLDLSRVQSGRVVVLQVRRCPLCPLIVEVVNSLRPAAPHHRFELQLPEEPVELDLDPGKITQVMENLLGNAIKFSPGGGTVAVAVRPEKDFCRVCVEDQGIGIPREQVSRIFEKFYRVDASDTGFAGLGLGLSITRQIVEAHGGRIWVESEIDQGTCVSFTLPLAR